MGLESQSTINPRHKSRLIKADRPSIAWIKFITPSSSFGPSLECPALESAQISWISPLNASLIFLDLALVIDPTGTCNGSLNALWFSSNELVELFVDQFIFNTMIDVTLKDLETTKQGVGKTFSENMTRWKGKASRMVNRPNEKDQINMIIKNLLSAYNSRLLSLPISFFWRIVWLWD